MSKYKTQLIRSAVIIAIILLSLLSGFICQSLFHKADMKKNPRDFSEYVAKYASEYGVPEYIVYGVIKYESGFASNKVGEDGGVGLMGVHPDEFNSLLKITKENLTGDALYGPETNIKYGTFQLSYLYNSFGSWETALAAKIAGQAEAEAWLDDRGNYDEAGVFENIPNGDAESAAEKCMKAAEKYRELYYSDLAK